MKPPMNVVLRHVKANHEISWARGYTYETVAAETGCTEDEAYKVMEEADDLGYTECGVSLRTAWLTDLGQRRLDLILEKP